MNSTTEITISIVVPVYNSQDCVIALVKAIDECLNLTKYQLILVNDDSSDKSWEEIKKVKQEYKNVVAINLRKNSGQDNAIMAGFSAVKGRYVVIVDDDLQHDPKNILALISKLEAADADVCFAKFPTKKQKLWKNFGSWLNGKMAEIIINKPGNIYLSPYKVIRKEIIEEIVKYQGPFPYIDGLLFSITQKVTQTEVEHLPRYSGKSNYTFMRSIAVWLKLMTSFSVVPLRIAGLLGLFTSIGGFFMATFFIFKYFIIGEPVEGWTSLMVIVLIFNGTILLALGGIGEYIGRAYLLLNRKPQYSIKEVIE